MMYPNLARSGEAVMAGKIFINYRRDDAIGTAGRLHDRLAQTFGRDNLFMDVDHIPVGADFVEYLHSQVAACDVFLAIIGPNWLNAKDNRGRRRFDNPDDYVTIEIAAALARNIRVIPVLVDNARMPNADKLPDSVKPLVRRNAFEIRNTQFGRDAEALANKVREALQGARPATRQWPFMASAAAWLIVAGGAMALLLAGWIGLYQIGVPVWVSWTPRQAPERYSALVNQSYTDIMNADYDSAIAAASEAMRLDPKDAIAFVSRGLAYARKGDNERAIADYTQAIRLDPNNVPAFFNRGFAYQKKGDNERAIADYTQAIRLDPNNVPAFFNRGFAYQKKGDMDRAIADFNEARRLDPKNANAFATRGTALKGDNDLAIADRGTALKDDIDRAIAVYTEAIRLDSNNATAFFSRGLAYRQKGDIDRAIADFNEAIRLEPKNASAYCNRGDAKLKINDASGYADIAQAWQLDAICR
jgi:tetratricopeptide (TPR) repeat protein